MTAALQRFLPDFDLMKGRAAASLRVETPSAAAAADPAELERAREEGRREGRAEAAAELAAAHEAEISALAARHEAELAALAARLNAQAAEAVPAAIEARTAEIAECLAADVAAVLQPFLAESLLERTIGALRDEIRSALAIENAGAIAVSGPADLLDALKDRLQGLAADLSFEETDDVELVVTMDRTAWSTRLDSWAAALREPLR